MSHFDRRSLDSMIRKKATTLHAMRIPLNKGGYSPIGEYFGVGEPLFRFTEYGTGHVYHVRAANMSAAKKHFPNATFASSEESASDYQAQREHDAQQETRVRQAYYEDD